MSLKENLKSKYFWLHFLLYNIFIFIIAFSINNSNIKLMIMIITIVETYYLVIAFKKTGFVIGFVYNISGILVIFSIYKFDSLYHNSIMAHATASMISLIFIYWHVQKTDSYEEKLVEASTTDLLSGLYNNRYYTRKIEEELSRAKRENKSLGLLIIDIDKFKNINDTYGHEKGDFVIRTLCNEISKVIRIEDIFCRYGGDEFTIIITNYTNKAANKVSKKIFGVVNYINKNNLLLIDESIYLSIGISNYPNDSVNKTDLFKNADAAMYQSKKYDGNMYTLYEDILIDTIEKC